MADMTKRRLGKGERGRKAFENGFIQKRKDRAKQSCEAFKFRVAGVVSMVYSIPH